MGALLYLKTKITSLLISYSFDLRYIFYSLKIGKLCICIVTVSTKDSYQERQQKIIVVLHSPFLLKSSFNFHIFHLMLLLHKAVLHMKKTNTHRRYVRATTLTGMKIRLIDVLMRGVQCAMLLPFCCQDAKLYVSHLPRNLVVLWRQIGNGRLRYSVLGTPVRLSSGHSDGRDQHKEGK